VQETNHHTPLRLESNHCQIAHAAPKIPTKVPITPTNNPRIPSQSIFGHVYKNCRHAQLRELIEEMTVEIPAESEQPSERSTSGQPGIAIMPFMGEGDEIVGNVIARLLAVEGIGTHLISWRTFAPRKWHV
jgi:hypothetical protein